MEHKIRDCPLVVLRFKLPSKDAPISLAEGSKKEEWTTIGCKRKASLAPKYLNIALSSTPLPTLQNGEQMSSIEGLVTILQESIPIV